MNGAAPSDEISVRHNYAGYIDRQVPVAELIEMQNVGAQFADQRSQELRRFRKILFRFLHPLQAEGRRTIVKTVEMVHPSRLIGKWNLPEAHERDVHSACNQPRNQFASIAPRTRQ